MVINQNFPTLKEIKATAVPSAYEIDTGEDFIVPNNRYLIGMAKVNNRGVVAPVASVCLLIDMKTG
jgi:hypothetical protein